jgi:predicted permease
MIAWLHTAWSRLRATFTADRLDRDLDEELAAHLEMLTDELRADGLSERDARREAARKIGHLDLIREDHRQARGLTTLDLLAQSLRHALRRLARTPVFTVVVILTLSVGIGANTALFSLVDNLLLRSLPVRDPDQLVQLEVYLGYSQRSKPHADRFDRSTFATVRAQKRIVEDVVGFDHTDRVTITIDGESEPERAVDWASADFFRGLGVQTVIGRTADTLDSNVAVISARWWRSRFGSNIDVLGRALAIDGTPYTIIGVVPPRFHGFDIDRSTDIWITGAPRNLMMVARLRPGVSGQQARVALHPLLTSGLDVRGEDEPLVTETRAVGQGVSELRTQYGGALWALMALVTLVLFTTCANVGNLVMLRNTARRRELALRSALGAGRYRLLAHSLVETTLLALTGCVGGLLLARWGVSIVVAMLPLSAPPGSLAFQADQRVLLFASGICALSALLFGVGPALRVSNIDVAGTMQTGFGSTAPKRARYFGRVLVTAQVAFSVLLLVGAGLFVQTLRNLSRLQMGYNTERLVEVRLDSRFAGYTHSEVPAIDRLLMQRVGAVPGVRSVTRTQQRLMESAHTSIGLLIEGLDRSDLDSGGQTGMWDALEVGPEFFETMGIPVVRGRTFMRDEFSPDQSNWREDRLPRNPTHAQFVDWTRAIGPFVVNESFARHFPTNVDPLGPSTFIVGIVKDVKLLSVKDEEQPLMFIPARRPGNLVAMQVRTSGDPRVEVAIRKVVADVNPRLLTGMSTLAESSGRSIAKERMVASISGFFGVLGLVLAAIGIFGIASNAVTQRTKELGIRRALGAGRWMLVRDSLRETLVVIGLGLTVGAAAAFVGVRVTSTQVADLLFEITTTNALNLMAAVALMVVVGLAACVLPALRATRVDPLLAIRAD